jgi:hypothetical protein
MASAAADCPAAFGRTDKAVRPYLLLKMARFLNHALKIVYAPKARHKIFAAKILFST